MKFKKGDIVIIIQSYSLDDFIGELGKVQAIIKGVGYDETIEFIQLEDYPHWFEEKDLRFATKKEMEKYIEEQI